MKRNKERKDRLRKRIRSDSKVVLILNTVLNLLIIGILIRSVLLGNYGNAFICFLSLLLFTVPALVERSFHIKLPETLEVIVLLFIFCAEILGELGSYYIRYPHWDTMLHITWGFLCAALGFSLVDIINRNTKIKFNLAPVFVAIVAFCFSMTVGVLWEFFEFGADTLLHTDMQKDTVITSIYSTKLDPTKSNEAYPIEGITETAVNGQTLDIDGYLDVGLHDTMEDLFVNFIGAVVFSVIGYFYIKKRGRGKFASRFIPVVESGDAPNPSPSESQPKRSGRRREARR